MKIVFTTRNQENNLSLLKISKSMGALDPPAPPFDAHDLRLAKKVQYKASWNENLPGLS